MKIMEIESKLAHKYLDGLEGIEINIDDEMDTLPFEDSSQDFILASHVLEHCSDPIGVLWEWDRVVRNNGYIFIIVPKRSAPYGDQDRMISNMRHFREALEKSWTDEDAHLYMVDRPTPEFDRHKGHVWVFNLKSLIALVEESLLYNWDVQEAHQTDDTDGTGHMVILRKVYGK